MSVNLQFTWSALIPGALLVLCMPTASASETTCDKCGGTGICQETETITVNEVRTICETHYREEEQVRVRQVPKTIQIEKQVPYEYNALVRVKKEDVQEIEVKTPKFRWVDQKYSVNVPGKDTVTKFRERIEMQPTIETCVVKEDRGHYETQMVPSDTCDGCLCTEKKTWIPCIVEVEKHTTVMKPVKVKEPYVCEVSITVPIEKTRRVKEYFTKTEKKTVKHPYTTLEYRKKTKMVTAYLPETIYEDEFETCTVKVPYMVERQVVVPVTRQVPKSCPCNDCCEHESCLD